MTNCCVCQEETRKYKCPKCREVYCSLNCYKEHKKVECEIKATDYAAPVINPEQTEDLEPTLYQPFNTEDTVPFDKLQELRNSKPLRGMLRNRHLRALLQELDVAANPWKAACAAMREPLFVEFADECLNVVAPMTAEELRLL